MKHSSLTGLVLFTLILSACATSPGEETAQSAYDAELAERLGADEYGMHSYVFVLLKTGPANITDPEERQALFAGHFANMGRLAEAGQLVLAGPFIEGEPKRGLFILDVDSIEAAQALVQTDPAVAAGIFEPEYTRYYGSAALKEINRLHSRLQRTPVG